MCSFALINCYVGYLLLLMLCVCLLLFAVRFARLLIACIIVLFSWV